MALSYDLNTSDSQPFPPPNSSPIQFVVGSPRESSEITSAITPWIFLGDEAQPPPEIQVALTEPQKNWINCITSLYARHLTVSGLNVCPLFFFSKFGSGFGPLVLFFV